MHVLTVQRYIYIVPGKILVLRPGGIKLTSCSMCTIVTNSISGRLHARTLWVPGTARWPCQNHLLMSHSWHAELVGLSIHDRTSKYILTDDILIYFTSGQTIPVMSMERLSLRFWLRPCQTTICSRENRIGSNMETLTNCIFILFYNCKLNPFECSYDVRHQWHPRRETGLIGHARNRFLAWEEYIQV